MACFVPGCSSHASKKENGREIITFHRIPENVILRKKWLDAILRTDLSCKITGRKVCSKHFTTTCFHYTQTSSKNRRLKHDATPTMFLPPVISTQGISTTLPSISSLQAIADVNPVTSTQDVTATLPSTSSLQAITGANPEAPRSHNSSAVLPNSNASESVILRKKVKDLERKLSSVSEISKRRLRLINKLKQRARRLEKKTSNLHTILQSQVDINTINEEQLLTLQNLKVYSLLDRIIKKKQGDVLCKEYPLELKKFAVTLHFLSPNAYNFVRDYLENALPHPKTISSWYKAIICESGFTSESGNTIRLRVESQNKTQYYALIIDEMAIHKIVE